MRQDIVYQQPILPPHLEGMILTSPFLWASSGSQDLDSPFFPKSDLFISDLTYELHVIRDFDSTQILGLQPRDKAAMLVVCWWSIR